MRIPIFLLLTLVATTSLAQIDTVVVQYDSTFMSLFARRLNDKRTPVKYRMEECGNVRNVAVFLSSLEEIVSGRKFFGVRIDTRANRNLFTDAPITKAEYIDEDELPMFIQRLEQIQEIMKTDIDKARYTEYRFYTRSGIALECYTGISRWRVLLYYELNKQEVFTYLNNDACLNELIDLLKLIDMEIRKRRSTP
jgi:hypothetical protein